ncbi:MAG TPA: universal stress protein [Tepidisphaeraceae bacterium]|jgi:nucleotide-binding universal stress UspA family protein
MYQTILVTLDATSTDRKILEHVKPLAKSFGAKLVLLHVADGWTAHTYGPEGVSREIEEDRAYLATLQRELKGEGIEADAELAFGNPASEIVKWVNNKHCDLVAMSTHGHRFFGDLFLGATAHKVQHRVSVPVLLLRAK